MNPVTLTAFLAPFLPALLNLGAKAAAGVATKAGETAGTQATLQAMLIFRVISLCQLSLMLHCPTIQRRV